MGHSLRASFLGIALAGLFAAVPAPAQPAVPAPLAPWVPWVLDAHPDLRCPLVGEARVCAWPGVLRLALDDRGGSFELRVHADRELDLPLPGDATLFPRDVSVDGRPALLRRLGDAPALRLPAGEHLLRGSFRWPRLPESLPLPREIALVDLRLRGAKVARPHREAGGLLWLAAREAEESEENGLSVEVYRRLQDGVPALLETRLLLRVSGAAREIDLGEPLPALFEPYELESDLPARYGRDRRLRVQLRAGEWSLRLAARSRGPLLEVAGAERPAPWPSEEIWVFAADPAIRAVQALGGASIDPQRTSLPAEWKSLPAFQIAAGDTLRFEELRRGEPEPPPDELAFERKFWLSLDGERLTSRDEIAGTLNQGGRLEVLPPAELGRAALSEGAEGGAMADQVITRSPDGASTGIEVRKGALAMQADSVYPRGGPLPAVGWNRDASRLSIELQLPPGFSLFATSGVDVSSGAWVDRWTLLDFFLLLILALSIWKLVGTAAAALALLTLTLSWHEEHALVLVWLLLALLALRGLALLRPEGAPRRVLRLVTTGALLVMLVVFIRWQWRIGRNPQLDDAWIPSYSYTAAISDFATRSSAPEAMPQQAEGGQVYEEQNVPNAPPPAGDFDQLGRSDEGSFAKPKAYQKRAKQIDPNAVVQTGPGVPVWQWRSYHLSWQGPVKSDQELRLYLLSPGKAFFLAILRIAGWLALLALLLGWRPPFRRAPAVEDPATQLGDAENPPFRSERAGEALRATKMQKSAPLPQSSSPRRRGSSLRLSFPDWIPAFAGMTVGRWWPTKELCGPANLESSAARWERFTTSVAAAVLLALSLAAPPISAQEPAAPPADLLAELEKRLTRPPECAPDCLELSRLVLRAGPGGLQVEADLHAAATTAWALPGPASAFVPSEVVVDGRPASAIRLQEDGFLALRLERGVHRVSLRGPARDSLSLQFPLPPRVLEFSGDGFTIDGFREDESPPGLVRIDRTLPSGEDSPAAAVELSPWLELGRRLDIGMPWMVHYQLRRLSPQGAAVLLRVPLLPGEAVTSAGVPVEAGEALVSLEPGETLREWSTTLSERPTLSLESPLGRPWLERWELLCSPIWHCTPSGLAPVRHMQEGEWRPEWRPWPGEKLEISFLRPEGAPGQTATLDMVWLQLAPGRRLLEGQLTLDARASRGGEQRIGLPADAELLGFTIDGNPVPVQNLGGQVVYTLEPGGRRIDLRWRQDHQAGIFEKMPPVSIPGEAANLMIQVTLPQHRWMLFTGGPDWGPVVLFWHDLVAILIAAFALGRFAPTPLRTVDWALLLTGLTQVPFAAAVVVVVWLLLLGWRQRPPGAWKHDFFQLLLLGLGLASLIALYAAIHSGLLMAPDMQVAGAGSHASSLVWVDERVGPALPQPWLVWVPIAVYRGVMLLWALWLAVRLLRWLPWCWRQLYREGRLFRLPAAWREERERRRRQPPPPAYQPPPSPPASPPPPGPGEKERL
jgi:hypothetical protein